MAVEVARQLMIYPSAAARTAEGEPIPGDERIFAEPTREVAEGMGFEPTIRLLTV
jgi:hypothetical protein